MQIIATHDIASYHVECAKTREMICTSVIADDESTHSGAAASGLVDVLCVSFFARLRFRKVASATAEMIIASFVYISHTKFGRTCENIQSLF